VRESVMRMGPIALAAVLLVGLSSGAGAVSVTFGNHQGGLIPSPPDLRSREVRSAIAQVASSHCAAYDRSAYITGVVPGYGNYVSFKCRFPRGYDPVKQGASFWWSPR